MSLKKMDISTGLSAGIDKNSLRREFLSRSWEILWRYMQRLGEDDVISQTDSRGCAGVIKNLFEGVDRAEGGLTEDLEDTLPEIDEAIIDEIIERAAKKAVAAPENKSKKKVSKTVRSKKPRVSPHPAPPV